MVTDTERATLIAYVRSRDPRLINPSRRTPEQDIVYKNALSDIERQLQEERLIPARATPTQHRTAIVTDADRANLRAYVRSRAQRVKNPSRRTPERETVFNNADNVERQLQEDGHKIWGWVIYRCTYANDETGRSSWLVFATGTNTHYVQAMLSICCRAWITRYSRTPTSSKMRTRPLSESILRSGL
jgi:hypothetical protein